MTFRLALIGFGGVNQGLVELLKAKQGKLGGLDARITAVADLRLGLVCNSQGLNLDELLETAAGGFSTTALSRDPHTRINKAIDLDSTLALISSDDVDVIVEATFTDPSTGEPALSHCRAALAHGKHVITTNKGPIALAQRSLANLAAEHGVQLKYEGAVMSGTPVLRQISTTLQGCEITGFAGILNGTSNFVLERLAQGHEFDAAVREAQALGYAEANPAADLEGSDVQLKVVILANTLWNAGLTRADVPCRGIASLTGEDIRSALASGRSWRLVGSAMRETDGSIHASVEPRELPACHPLAAIGGVTNAITFETDVLGSVTISGPGAGRQETAFAILSDLIELAAQTELRGQA
ncbi:homoserine dehydrogenase [Aquitalea magnusonii]|nr:homoserine dehydrogenase [Aquitalea magnusonii]